jgi:hypothetical protein
MHIHHSEDFQTQTGKNYSLAWVEYFSSFRFYNDGQKYLARNYKFNIIAGGGEFVRATVAIDEAGINEFEKLHQRKLTQEEQSDIARQQLTEYLNTRSELERNNLIEVKPDLLMRIVQELGMQ